MDWLELHEPMTRRRALLLGVGPPMTTLLAACRTSSRLGVEHALPEGAETFNSGNANPGESFSHTFDVVGEYAYSCMLHRPMAGHLTVTA